ncbi:LysM peptidoglycan-binding domain-containing protein [Paenisporosarcina sp.]|uniref:LysM peptidoglycan-binding domain-containing protein n=1 Tax=Paenisporosarcina sp. TaxID=1932001 RepID=UPI003C70B826
MTVSEITQYVYTVQPGDTLYSIANRFDSTVAAIEQANSLYPPFTDPGLIFPGQLLIIPGGRFGFQYEVYDVVSPSDTLFSIAQRFSVSTDLLFGINSQIANRNFIYANQVIWVPAFVYEVSTGDSLSRISSETGVPLDAIIRANQRRAGFSPEVLYLGYRLLMPLPASRNIVVLRPLPGDILQTGSLIQGMARAFEANVLYTILDTQGNAVSKEKSITARAAGPEYAEFSTNVQFDFKPATPTGELRVYTRSADDGSIQDLVSVKVRFE